MIKLEKATLDNAIKLTEISKNAFNDSSIKFGNGTPSGPPGYDSPKVTAAVISKYKTYKILYDEEIAGWLFISALGNGIYELSNICIDPKYQNLGIGSTVLKLIEEILPDAIKWTLETVCYSKRNHHFYEKSGYVKVAEKEDGFFYVYEKVRTNSLR